MYRRLVHRAPLRRAHVDAQELILCRNLAFDVFTDFRICLAQFLADLAGQIAIDLNDLQLCLGNLTFGLCTDSYELCALPANA